MKLNWLTKLSISFPGKPTETTWKYYNDAGTNFDGDPEQIYQSRDLPWVFLGSADNSDIQKVQSITGKPVCMRLDLTDADTSDLPQPAQKIPFPEHETWDEGSFDLVSKQFNNTVEQLINMINRKCPIYVHCSAGVNRSVSVLAAAISRITNRSVFDILREMKSTRGIIGPHDAYVMMAIQNSNHPSDILHRRQIELDFSEHDRNPVFVNHEPAIA